MAKDTTTRFAAATSAATSPNPAPPATVEQAFEALTNYDHGSSRAALMPLDEAVVASLENPAARVGLEQRLVAVLKGTAPAVAKEYACRKLSLIGSAASVSALANLLSDAGLSDPARTALEALPCPESIKALRSSLPKLTGLPKAGTINSLGVRRDTASVLILVRLLKDPDSQIAAGAVAALGNLGTPKAARALRALQPIAPDALRLVWADACLVCAERLMADGKKDAAVATYRLLADSGHPTHVRSAAKRGLSLAGQKQ